MQGRVRGSRLPRVRHPGAPMTRRHDRRRCPPMRAFTFVLILCGLAAAGVAHAAWSTTGGGNGDARTGTSLAVTLAPGTPTSGLRPGGSGDVVVIVTNPNLGPVTVASLALDQDRGDGGFGVDAAHPGCRASALTFARQTNGGVGWSVPGRMAGVDGLRTVTLGGALAMHADAANACQGMIASVYLIAGG
jgi:hypothetical protein